MIEIICKECDKKIMVDSHRNKMCPECSYEKKLERSREYKKKNKDSIKEYNKSYKAEHKEEISSYNKEYNLNNRNIIQERINIKHKERRNRTLSIMK